MGKYQLRGVDPRTKYADMTADECYRAYFSDFRRARAVALIAAVAIAVLSVAAASFSNWLFYAIGIFAVGLIAVLLRQRTTAQYAELIGVLTHDCDPEKLRAVLERGLRRTFRKRTKMLIQDDLALCDYYCDDPAGALERIKGVEVRSPRDKLGIRVTNLELLCCRALGDEEGAKRALAELKELRGQLARGSEWAVKLEQVYESGKEMLRPHDQWTKKDAQRMYRRLQNADTHLNRVTAQLRLAEYELLHCGAAEARRLLEDPALEPLTPRARAERAELLARL